MEYPIIQPPFTLNFREMTKKELKAYKEWFFYILPERIEILIKYVQSTPGFENWNPDYSPDSLNMLGEWFAIQAERRLTTQQERDKQLEQGKVLKTYSEWELTNKTYSLCIDIGMYLSQVFFRNYSSLEWDQVLKPRMHADYGQPVLSGFDKNRNFNPVDKLIVIASGTVDNTWKGGRLREVYNIWEKFIQPPISESAK